MPSIREEAPHYRFSQLFDWAAFGSLIADQRYTSTLVPDRVLECVWCFGALLASQMSHSCSLQHCGINMESADVLRDALLKNGTIVSLKFVSIKAMRSSCDSMSLAA